MSEFDDMTLGDIENRYATDPAFRVEADIALGVTHRPEHAPGECPICDHWRAAPVSEGSPGTDEG